MDRSNVDIMQSATGLEVMRRGLAVDPAAADTVRAQGRDSFYNAFWGRYGLPGNAMSRSVGAGPDAADGYDLTNMSVRDVIALARDLLSSGLMGRTETALLGFDFARLSFAADPVFAASPLSVLQGGLSQPKAFSSSYNWLAEYQGQLKNLEEYGASPAAIKGTRNVLTQLNKLQTEQSMYWAMGFYSDGNKRKGGDFLAGGLIEPRSLTLLQNDI